MTRKNRIDILLVSHCPFCACLLCRSHFLLISLSSPQANAMGETYGTIVGRDPIATVMNPASLGLWAQNHSV